MKHSIYDKKKNKVVEKTIFEAAYMEALVDEQLKKIHISEGLFQVFKRQLYTFWMEQCDITKKRVAGKRKEIEKQEEKRRKLNESLFSDKMNEQSKIDLEGSITEITQTIRDLQEEVAELQDVDDEQFEKAWQSLNVLLQAKKIFAPEEDMVFEPKRRLVLSLFLNLKFLDGKIIPEWHEPFATIANSGVLTKQKSKAKPEISEGSSIWLPVVDIK